MKFKGDIIITDPCYIIKNNTDDWMKCCYGDYMEKLGIKNYMCRDTIYGDWSCTTFNSDTKEELGRFCADTGLVAVFLLDEVLKYKPDFDWFESRPWTTTLIKDFDGDVDFDVDYSSSEYGEPSLRVVGTGNINFETYQTGF